MKSYRIFYFDERTQTVCKDEGMCGYIKEVTPILALKKWYAYVNSIAGCFKTFTYEAIESI